MNTVNDNKPRIILNEYKVTKNIPKVPTVIDKPWSLRSFKSNFRIVIIRNEDYEMEFDLIGIHPFLSNMLRRLIISEVPSMAIEKVHIQNNTSVIQDEVLAHRLGLIPLKADPRLFELKADPEAEGTEVDTLEFELKIKCTMNKDGSKDSARPDDMYKHNNVYSKHIAWIPIGSQDGLYDEIQVGPIEDDILIAKLRPGHELDMKLVAVKGIGKDHAKFSPVATAYYRLLPDIKLTREVEGEQAVRLQNCFSAGVIGLKEEGDKVIAVVNNPRYDFSSRNVFRYEDLKDAVIMTKIEDHFIFTIESVGAMEPADIFKESILILKKKCSDILEELNSF